MRSYWPKKNCLFISSKSRARLNARRTRGVAELGTPGIQNEGLHDTGAADRKFLLDDTLVDHRRKIIGRRPIPRDVLDAPIDLVGLERFERHRRVAEIFVAQLVEIIPADIHRQVLAPIVLDALVDDGVSRHEFLDPVGAIAERRLERGGRDVAPLAGIVGAFEPVFGQHAELPRRSAAFRGCRGHRR